MLVKNRFTELRFLILIINFPSLYVEASHLQRRYIHQQGPKTWVEAQNYCREHHTDLAKIEAQREFTQCKKETLCWIGLHKDTRNPDVWNWSGGEKTKFTNWDLDIPQPDNYGGNENCVAMTGKFWYDVPCDKQYAFLCYEDDLILVKEKKTWEEAVEHCRTLNPKHPFDLAHVHIREDHGYTKTVIRDAQTDEVWMGLRFLAGRWLWVNRKPLGYGGLPACPAEGKNCGTVPKTGGLWAAKHCEGRRNFLCAKRQ
ncbi:macrophage mannose receptor 1-like [Centroberyx gerrardi]|uniref:macrophage mannose receptor 1-like n=1 Tax=Centroberyx gerrardi TaxID=166262 RepID=UPI003AB0626A